MLSSILKLPAQIEYPYPVHFIQLIIENKRQQMAPMDVLPKKSNVAPIPGCKLVIIPGATHIAHIQEPENSGTR